MVRCSHYNMWSGPNKNLVIFQSRNEDKFHVNLCYGVMTELRGKLHKTSIISPFYHMALSSEDF